MKNTKISLSAIQPTGIFTIGNYIGAIKNWALMQKDYSCIYFVANMHSLTTIKDKDILQDNIYKTLALLIAFGLDIDKHIVFVQSDVPQHSQLAWVLQCCTQFGELKRMTQFKYKSSKNKNDINAGLFCYPALMAADILLYSADVVPIGVDQKQHLELTQNIADRFNKTFGETFKIPRAIIPQTGAKIKSLLEPLKKMSKSGVNNSFISVLDTFEVIENKLKKAVTDSDGTIRFSKEKPGISNLICIYSCFSDLNIKQVEEKFKNKNYKDFKLELAEVIYKKLSPIQEQYNILIKHKEHLEKIRIMGAKKATKIAENTLKKVYKNIGFLR